MLKLRRGWSTKRAIGAFVAAVALVSVAACGGGSDSGDSGKSAIKLTIGSGAPVTGSTYTKFTHEFFVPEVTKRVAAETDYTVEFDEQYGGSIAGVSEILSSTQSGLLDIGLVGYPFESANLKALNISYHVPFGPGDGNIIGSGARHMLDENPEVGKHLESTFNQRILAVGTSGNYGIASKFEINKVSDVDGKKLSGAGTNLEWVKAAGAVPVQGTLGDWYEGIKTGVYEGAVIYADGYAGFNLFEVAPHFTNVEFGSLLATGVHMNLDTLNDLPKEVLAIIEEVAAEYEKDFGNVSAELEAAAAKTLADEGVEISEFPASERAKWAEMLPNFPQTFADELTKEGFDGKKIVNDYLEGVEKAGYEWPRNWQVK